MKLLLGIFLLSVTTAVYGDLHCEAPNPTLPNAWIDMTSGCITAVRDQIQKEIDASFQYLAMGAHFSRDTVNRPGFADFFFDSAKEEREHAQHLIDYLTMRGQLTGEISSLIKIPTHMKTKWNHGVDALTDALNLEAQVTKSIKGVIEKCESDIAADSENNNKKIKVNDYHLVDYLTGVYLEEQHHGQRELAGKLSTLSKMMKHHGEIGEFLFDKTLKS
ncbi:ferritin subunit [Condylostylus longicornis]|uniref:ferritin subunit n=1 Tax=Condylostylus longicornis TaxID=2530218 RepID=UPI00244DB3E2|nr:ferritin subunit [Condylostylus longicornis]XP_055384871.1 ferritin subunit [Condylostylus longicornis]